MRKLQILYVSYTGCVYVYTTVYKLSARPCTGRVHGRYTAVYMARVHGHVHGPYSAPSCPLGGFRGKGRGGRNGKPGKGDRLHGNFKKSQPIDSIGTEQVGTRTVYCNSYMREPLRTKSIQCRIKNVSHSAQSVGCFIMVALWNRADHYIFMLWFLWSPYVIGQTILFSCCFFFFLLFFPRLISAVGDWKFTILWHMVWP